MIHLIRFPGYILAFSRALLMILVMVVFMISYVTSLLVTKNSSYRTFRLRRNYCRVACWILNIKMDENQGQMIDEPALYISNHRSFSDPVISCKKVNAYVIAKAEIASMPIISQGARLTGVVLVKRQDASSREKTRSRMIDLIKDGFNVMVYPEGTTSNQAQALPFKKGTFYEAAEHDIPIVPICLEYQSSRDMWHGIGMFAQFFKQYSKWATHVKQHIGPPLRSDDGALLAQKAEQWMNEELARMQAGWTKAF